MINAKNRYLLRELGSIWEKVGQEKIVTREHDAGREISIRVLT